MCDQESRLLHGDVNEREPLAERIARSSSRVLQATESDPGSINLVERTVSPASISPTPLAQHNSGELVHELSEPRDSHQASGCEIHTLAHPKEPGGLTARTDKENPYLYIIGVTGYFKRLRELWVNRRCRRALLSAAVAMISQQMSGNDCAHVSNQTPNNSRYQHYRFSRNRSVGELPRTVGVCQGVCDYRSIFWCRELLRWASGSYNHSGILILY